MKHDPLADRAQLRKLAKFCDRYTPVVALEEGDAPESLLLDITGSAHLFGGERGLTERAAQDLRDMGYAVRIAIADGVGAAWAVAHSHPKGPALVPPGKNTEVIPQLGVDVLRLPGDVVHLLHQFDLRRIRQLMDLPRGQVAMRFGQETLTRLDQALGLIPEIVVPEPHVEPVRAVWAFEDPISHPYVVEKVLERLIGQIVEALAPRHLGVQRLFCSLTTADKNRTDFAIGLLHPTVSAERLLGLARLRLERTKLPAAVAMIEARARTAPLDVRQARWFDSEDDSRREAAFRDFVERVSSRLGDDTVLQPRLCPEEQPEYAWRYVPWLRREKEASCPPVGGALGAPIDLLAEPAAVHVEMEAGRPRRFTWRQRLYEIAQAWGPRRIETGWWRGRDVRRDYYRVEAEGGERFWLFRDRTRGAWFLHGVFA